MKFKHSDIDIPLDDPFKNCRLNRKEDADILSQIVQKYAEGFVLSINGEWGTGKSTFVKMWKADLELQGIKSIYFNAWENDFISNPMVALLGELHKITTSTTQDLFSTILQTGSLIATKAIPSLLKCATKQFLGEDLAEIAKEISAAGSEVFRKEVLEYDQKQEKLISFRKILSDFIQKSNLNHPLIFIVDELDRCRPDYAVEVLERIKHFFSIKGIVFVLSIDKEQLCNSIRGHYGSDRINAEEYLRRFIDVEYQLPQPDINSYCKYLYEYFDFKDFFNQDERARYQFSDDKKRFLQIASEIIIAQHYSLRQIEKLFVHFRLVLCSCQDDHYIFPELTFILICIRTTNPVSYHKIINQQLSLNELAQLISDIFPYHIFNSASHHSRTASLWGLGELFYFYSKSASTPIQTINPVETDDTDKAKLTFKIENINNDHLAQAIMDCGKAYPPLNWNHIIKSIDLLNPIVE